MTSARKLCLESDRWMLIKIIVSAVLFFISYLPLHAQYNVHFNVYDPSRQPDVFIVGSFNNWNAGDPNYKLSVQDPAHKSITIRNIPPGKIMYKFTRGDWGNVESTSLLEDIKDRIAEIHRDTIINVTIEGWLDSYLDLSSYPDTASLVISMNKCFYFQERNLDSSYKYGTILFDIAKRIGDEKSEVTALTMLGYVLQQQGNNDKALDLFLKAQPMAEKLKDSFALAWIFRNMGNVFEATKELPRAKSNFLNAIKFTSASDDRFIPLASVSLSLGKIYFNAGQLDSAKYYAEKSFSQVPLLGSMLLLGDIYKKQGNKEMSLYYYRISAEKGIALNNPLGLSEAYQRIAMELMEEKKVDSAFFYARNAYRISTAVKNPYNIAQTGKFLSGLFEKAGIYDSAFYYQQVVINVNDSLFTSEKEKLINNLLFKEQLKEQEIRAEQDKFKSKVWIYTLSGGFVLLLFAAGFLIRNNRQKRNANTLLQHQKDQIQTTLSALKATQSQLIQSEKMASLGELTAGIAHEIQNPLNFVNNFSEISRELLAEMDVEVDKGNIAEVKVISADIQKNLEKINHHGKRADSIVKGMLQHSQKGSGLKVPTDINALAEEYLRLSYHGIRAKDNTMNASMVTSLDESIGEVDLVQQDISRVLLNLYNNAFYAVAERFRKEGEKFKPMVTLTTKKYADHITITVQDNGSGIPEEIKNKIFQPFFTTKPSGQGTGLGLSLSYDIIKAHQGSVQVQSVKDEGTEFIVQLPITSKS